MNSETRNNDTPPHPGDGFRTLTDAKIAALQAHGCSAEDWGAISVAVDFEVATVRDVAFSGRCRLGAFRKAFALPGGVRKPAGIYHATLHNVTVGDDCRLSNIRSYVANYDIGADTHIGNVDKVYVECETSFGNGVEVSVLNETGGREVTIHAALTAHEAYLEAMYRHRPRLIAALKLFAKKNSEACRSARGTIGRGATIMDTGLIRNVFIGDGAVVDGAARLSNGSLMSCLDSPVVIGRGVSAVDVIWRQFYPGGASPRVTAPFPRYASLAMRQNGGRYALSETFGIFGDSVSPAQMKWLIDYQMVRGINVFVFGYWALSNARQWMLLFEPHSGPVVPYWEMEGPFFRYIRETAKFLSHGHPAVETAVLYDTRAFWAGGTDSKTAAQKQYAVAAALDNANTDFDFVDDEAIAVADVTADGLKVGAMTYRTVVLPTVKWLRPSAWQKLSEFTAAGGNVVGLEDLAKVPRTCRVTGAGSEDIRVTKRIDGERTIYFIVNENVCEREVAITFPEKGPVVRWDWESGRLHKVPLLANGSFTNYFEGAGSKMFVVGGESSMEEPVYAGEKLGIESGWTLRKLVSHEAGETDFVVRTCSDLPQATALGDWRASLGTAFSGKAVYRVTFNSPRAGMARLDLGKVCWCANVRLNGRTVGTKFFGPYVFDVELVKGENILEVTVANLLANQISDPLVRTRLIKRYPPSDNYERRQSQYDRENNESGLFGPVSVRFR